MTTTSATTPTRKRMTPEQKAYLRLGLLQTAVATRSVIARPPPLFAGNPGRGVPFRQTANPAAWVTPRGGDRGSGPGRPAARHIARLGVLTERRAAAVDRHHRAGDKARIGREQVVDHRGDLLAATGAPERMDAPSSGSSRSS